MVMAQFQTFGNQMIFIWLKYFRPLYFRLLALSSALLSSAILWSEATLAIPRNLSPFGYFLDFLDGRDGENHGILFQITALIPLLYMSICVYSSLFKLDVFGRFCLRGNKQSHGVALIFNAQYLVRLQFPLGYNYLLMLKYDTSSTTCAFSKIMGVMSVFPFFGTSFSVYAPLLIIALCAITLCNIYPRLLALVGFEHEDAILLGDKETLDGKVNEGISLMKRHMDRKETANTESIELGQRILERNSTDSTIELKSSIV